MTPRRFAVAGAAALALPAVALVGCGGSSSAAPKAGKRAIAARLSDYRISTSAARAAAGRVTFDVTNAGRTKHEMVVIRSARPAADLGRGSRISEAGSVGEVSDLAPGRTKRLTLSLKPGHYDLICNMPGHYMAGMHAALTVT